MNCIWSGKIEYKHLHCLSFHVVNVTTTFDKSATPIMTIKFTFLIFFQKKDKVQYVVAKTHSYQI